MALSPQVALAVSVWVQAVVYGIYVPLFFQALYIIARKRSSSAYSAKIFLGGSVVLFLLSTIDIGLNLLRLLKGFVLDGENPVIYFFDWTRWENMMHSGILYVATWIGDALAIYRCYVVWDRKKWVVVLPLILLLVSIGINVMLFVWFTHPTLLPPFATYFRWMGTVYPLAFAQNTITTGMIAFKVWKQHRDSTALGILNGSSVALFTVLRIIIESAMVYTVQLLILIIAFPLESWVQAIIQQAIVPSIGIVFVLIAVRVHYSQARVEVNPSTMLIPAWLGGSETNFSTNASKTDPARRSFRVSTCRPEGMLDEEIQFALASTHNRRRHRADVDLDVNSVKHMDDVDLAFITTSRHPPSGTIAEPESS
ncbi:hypothetical protein BJ165DRAFT_193942 [Panaeolus papilionaceus]|nr:hypothetical protein BJ165DRAFT_193942 [Panaeolus papilionaceus]